MPKTTQKGARGDGFANLFRSDQGGGFERAESADFQRELFFLNSHEVMKNNPCCLGYTKGMKFSTQLYRD